MRIEKRLILNAVLIVLFSVLSTSIILGWATYRLTKSTLENQVKNQLTVVRDIKKYQIESYFSLLRDQVTSIANDRVVVEAAEDLKKSFFRYPTEIQLVGSEISIKQDTVNNYYASLSDTYSKKMGYKKNAENLKSIFQQDTPYAGLQFAYVMENSNTIGQKFLLDSAGFPVSYNQAHKKYHIRFLDFLETFKIQDVYFIDPTSGFVFYSVQKNTDFGININKVSDILPGLYKVFSEANHQKGKAAVVGDFSSYIPAIGENRAFIAAPIFDGNKKIAILVFQIDIQRINDIMTNKVNWKTEGLGDTGETYLVGEDFRLRSMSRFFYENPDRYLENMRKLNLSQEVIKKMQLTKSSIGIQPVLTEGSKQAHNDNTGFSMFNNYRGISVLSAFAPLNISNIDWIILSEMDTSEAFYPITELLNSLIVLTISVVMALSFMGFWLAVRLSQRISRPIKKFAELIVKIGNDLDLTKRISVKTDDELSDMAKALNHLFDKFQVIFIQTVKSTSQMQKTVSILKKVAASKDGMPIENPPIRQSDNEERSRMNKKPMNPLNAKSTKKDAADVSGEQIVKASQNLETLSKKLLKISNQFKIIQKEARRTRDW